MSVWVFGVRHLANEQHLTDQYWPGGAPLYDRFVNTFQRVVATRGARLSPTTTANGASTPPPQPAVQAAPRGTPGSGAATASLPPPPPPSASQVLQQAALSAVNMALTPGPGKQPDADTPRTAGDATPRTDAASNGHSTLSEPTTPLAALPAPVATNTTGSPEGRPPASPMAGSIGAAEFVPATPSSTAQPAVTPPPPAPVPPPTPPPSALGAGASPSVTPGPPPLPAASAGPRTAQDPGLVAVGYEVDPEGHLADTFVRQFPRRPGAQLCE